LRDRSRQSENKADSTDTHAVAKPAGLLIYDF
jgi:hypothetical protein